MNKYLILHYFHDGLWIFTIMKSWPRLPGEYANKFDTSHDPEVTFDPELPIMPVTFDINNRKYWWGKKSQLTTTPVQWITMQWFLFGVHPYQPTVDFTFFISEWTIVKRIIHQDDKRASKRLGRPLSYNDCTDKKQNGCY